MVFRYAEGTNPNGSVNDIAGILNTERQCAWPDAAPENLIEPLHGATDCRPLFESLIAA